MPQKIVGFNEILVKSIDLAITEILGERVLTTLYQHFAEHYDITREEIPYRLDSLYTALDQTFGFKAARTLEHRIAKHLFSEFGVPLPTKLDYPLETYLDKIKKIAVSPNGSAVKTVKRETRDRVIGVTRAYLNDRLTEMPVIAAVDSSLFRDQELEGILGEAGGHELIQDDAEKRKRMLALRQGLQARGFLA
jgi:hypothetical protein